MPRQTDETPTPEFMTQMLAVLQAQAQALSEQNERTKPKENPNYIASSPFLKGNGDPWASDLKCEIFLGPILLNRTPLTEAEVKALNSLSPVEKAAVTKTDGSVARATVRAKEDAVGRIDRLTIEIPMKKDDNPQHLPALQVIAEQIAAQVPVAA